MNRRDFLKMTGVGALTTLTARSLFSADGNQKKPNIIIILTDDQGYGDISRHGNPVLQTPNMDGLHDESVRFRNFCVSPSCSPTRCAIMTGMHEFKSGVTHTIKGRNVMSLESTTLAEVLRGGGYATGIFGKWHLGHEGEYRPEKRGFDQSLTTIEDTQNSHFDPELLRNGIKEKHTGFREDILFREAMRFIEANSDKPFFCYIPTYSPHAPLKAPQEYIDRYKGKVSDEEAVFMAMVASIDDNIGRLLAKVKELSLDQKTIVILMNDNGATYGVDVWNARMRGCKGTAWFGGTRALSFWRWPGVLEPHEVEGLASSMDILPTLAEFAGIELTPGHKSKLDGISLSAQLRGKSAVSPDRMLFTHQGRWPTGEPARHKYAQCSVHWKQYHLVRNEICDDPKCKGECRVIRKALTGSPKVGYSSKNGPFHYAVTSGNWKLFDVEKDPSQEADLANKLPDVVGRMSAEYDKWWEAVLPLLKKTS